MRFGRIIIGIIIAIMLSVICVGAQQYDIYLNGNKVEPLTENHQGAINIDGVVYMPLRNIFEAIGASVMYSDEDIPCVSGGMGTIYFSNDIGKTKLVTNAGETDLPFGTMIKNNRSLIVKEGIEFVFGANVSVSDNRIDISYSEKEGIDVIDFSNLEE